MDQEILYCFEVIRNNLIQDKVDQKKNQILDFSHRELSKASEIVKSIKLHSSTSLLNNILIPPDTLQDDDPSEQEVRHEEPRIPIITNTNAVSSVSNSAIMETVSAVNHHKEILIKTEHHQAQPRDPGINNVQFSCEAPLESNHATCPEKPVDNPQDDIDEPQMEFDESISSPTVTKSQEPKECAFSQIVRESFLYIKKLRDSIKSFEEDPKLTDSIKNLKLCIKTTVNTISNNSVTQIREKSILLSNLFEKRPVRFQEKILNPDIHPLANDFCQLFTAETIIGVGTKMITSLPRASFSIGAVISSLWTKYENFGKIFLALLCEQCPYAIPCHPAKEEGMSESDHLILCGYYVKKDGKTLESEESYLNRMKAMIMLFAASIQMPSQAKSEFLSISHAWSWLTLLLNDDPQPLITPAILQGFLQMASYRMLEAYGRQFFKLIKFIESTFIPKIRDVTTKDMKRQTLVNLQLFIDDLLRKMSTTGQINEPEGFIRTSLS